MREINYEAEVAEYLARPKPRKVETRDALTSDIRTPESWLFELLLGRAQSITGISATSMNIRGVATVFACERVHMETMASLPCILYRGDGKDGQVEARDHRLFHALYTAPNVEMSSYDFFSSMQGHLISRHNAYAEVIRDMDGDAIGLYPMDPTQVHLYRDPKSLKLVYQFLRNGERFKHENILHLRNLTRNGLIGTELSTTLNEVFALALALQENAARFFGNGSRPGAVLEHPETLGPEAAERLQKTFDEATSGRNSYKTLLLEEGMKWSKQRSENRDAQFLESREYQDLQICRVYRVPPHKVGIKTNEARANIEEENLAFVSDGIRPQCVNWEKGLNMKLLTLEEQEQGYEFRFAMDELLRGQRKARYDSYAVGRQWGFLNVNQIKKMERMNPVGPDGDMHLQPANMVPLGSKPSEEANDAGVGDDLKGKKSKDGEKPVDGEKPEDGEDTPPKAAGKPGIKAGGGGVVKETKVVATIEQPPVKPKNLKGFEDTVTLNQT